MTTGISEGGPHASTSGTTMDTTHAPSMGREEKEGHQQTMKGSSNRLEEEEEEEEEEEDESIILLPASH